VTASCGTITVSYTLNGQAITGLSSAEAEAISNAAAAISGSGSSANSATTVYHDWQRRKRQCIGRISEQQR